MLRAVTISIVIGTFLIGSYYVVASSFIPPEQQNKLDMALSEIQPDLTYEKFIALPEDQKSFLIQNMPTNTRNLILDEARNNPSFAAESKDLITDQSVATELRMIKLTQISGDSALPRRHRIGLYPGEKDTHAVFINPRLAADRTAVPKGAIVVGLGSVGSLNAATLTYSMRLALLEYAVQ